MNNLGMGCKAFKLPRHPVVKPNANSNEKVGLANGHIGPVGPMHPEHAQPERIRPWKASKTHEGSCDWHF